MESTRLANAAVKRAPRKRKRNNNEPEWVVPTSFLLTAGLALWIANALASEPTTPNIAPQLAVASAAPIVAKTALNDVDTPTAPLVAKDPAPTNTQDLAPTPALAEETVPLETSPTQTPTDSTTPPEPVQET